MGFFYFCTYMSIEELHRVFLGSEGVTTDSRGEVKGKLFFALRGERYDGHHYVKSSLDKGCIMAVIDDSSYAVKGMTMLVGDVLSTLQMLATYHRSLFDMPMVAITGSNGKTTTKELMRDVLGSKFVTIATEGNLNNHIGVPLTLLRLRGDHDLAIIEMGANHIGEIDLLCRIARPGHGLITNIGKAHLEGFGSLQGVFTAKGELFRYLRRSGGKAFVNHGQPMLRKLAYDLGLDALYYGTGEGCFVKGKLIDSSEGIEGEIAAGDPPFNFLIRSHLAGSYNFENILAAVCVGTYFGVEPQQVKKAIENYVPSNNRSQLKQTKHNKLLLDAYNANPDSMRSALVNFSSLPGGNRSVILGDMLELGRYAEEEHSKIIRLLMDSGYREVILVGRIFSSIPVPGNFTRFESTDRLIAYLNENPLQDRFILLKGSRGIGLEKCIPFL